MTHAQLTLRRNAPVKRLLRSMASRWQLLLMFAVPLTWYIIFCYLPMAGIQIAFMRFNPVKGYGGSSWVGLAQFQRFFSSYYAWNVIRNTVTISLYALVVGFPAPILLALIINEIQGRRFKKTLQNVTYVPYFLSTVVVCGMIVLFLSPQYGVINTILGALGVKPIAFIETASMFKSIYVLSGVWQETGWASIIYIAALAGIDPALYEAATIDGASRLQKVRYISIPSITATIITLLILRIGQLMTVGFEKALLLQKDLNLEASEIISTVIFKNGIQKGEFSYSAAIGLLNSVINLTLIVVANRTSRRLFDTSLW